MRKGVPITEREPDAVHVRPARAWTPFTPWLAGLLVLVPFTTVPLPLTLGHRVQAAAVSGLVLGSIAWAWVRGRFRSGWPSLSHPVVAGVSLWAGATVLGLVVAGVRGNEPLLVAGQFLSMALLPAGALAGWGLGRDPWPGLARGVAAGGAATVVIHLIYWGCQLWQGEVATRLLLPNFISSNSIALLGLMLALVLAGTEPPSRRRWWLLAAGSFAIFIVGSGTRGLWLVTPPTLVIAVVMSQVWRTRWATRGVVGLAALVFLMGLFFVPLFSWWCRSHPVVATTAELAGESAAAGLHLTNSGGRSASTIQWYPESARDRVDLEGRIPVEGGCGYRLTASLSGSGQGLVWVRLVWLDGGNRVQDRDNVMAAVGPNQQVLVAAVAPSSSRYALVTLSFEGEPDTRVVISDVSLVRLGSPVLTVAGGLAAGWLNRLSSTVAVLLGREPPQEASLAFRIRESRHLLEQIRRAPWATRLLGHGLGATSPYPGFGFDGTGTWRRIGRIHYVHNFYIFALFKLGLIGLFLVAAALACWLVWTAAAARRQRGLAAGRFLAAMAASWIGYAVWSSASPEILNFRVAPLWGLLLAASIRAGDSQGRATGSDA